MYLHHVPVYMYLSSFRTVAPKPCKLHHWPNYMCGHSHQRSCWRCVFFARIIEKGSRYPPTEYRLYYKVHDWVGFRTLHVPLVRNLQTQQTDNEQGIQAKQQRERVKQYSSIVVVVTAFAFHDRHHCTVQLCCTWRYDSFHTVYAIQCNFIVSA